MSFAVVGVMSNCSLAAAHGFYVNQAGEAGAKAMCDELMGYVKKGVGLGLSSYYNGIVASTSESQTNGPIGKGLELAGFIKLAKYPGGHGGFVTIWFRGVRGKTELVPDLPKELPEWLAPKAVELVRNGAWQYAEKKADANPNQELEALKAEYKKLEKANADLLKTNRDLGVKVDELDEANDKLVTTNRQLERAASAIKPPARVKRKLGAVPSRFDVVTRRVGRRKV